MSKKENVRVGLVGCGFMGLTHLKSYLQLEGVEIAALCDARPLPEDGVFDDSGGNLGLTEPIRLDMSKVTTFTDYREMIEQADLDLVDICVHTKLHPEVAFAALARDRNVICEKPMALNREAAQAMVDAAEQSRGFLMPAMCLRFWPEWAWLKQAVADDTYGKVLAARFRRVSEPPGWSKGVFLDGKTSGGALLDLHIHDTDFIQHCFGRPSEVFSQGYTKVSGAIDHIVTQYRVPGDAIVHAEGGWAMTPGFGFNMAYTVNFEKATADYDSSRGDEALKVWAEGDEVKTVTCEGGNGYLGELKYAIACVQTGQAPQTVTAEDGLTSVELCEAEGRSVESGEPVML